MNTAQLPTKPDQVALTDAGRLEAKAKKLQYFSQLLQFSTVKFPYRLAPAALKENIRNF